MPEKLRTINPLEFPRWDELLGSSTGCSFFHTASWAAVLSESYAYRPVYFVSIRDGRVATLIPFMEIKSSITGTRGVSLPFTDLSEPILPADIKMDEALDFISGYGESVGWRFIELRFDPGLGRPMEASARYQVHNLRLGKDPEAVFANLSGSTKRNIRKSKKTGMEVSIETSIESMQEFYRMNCMTRKMHGLPPQPYHFFESIHRHVMTKGRGFVSIARYEGSAIAAAVYFHFGGKAIYKYGASDRRYQHLRPNNRVMWEAVKWLSENGCSEMSLGRTEPANTGLMRFKEGWGASSKPLEYYRLDLKMKSFVAGESRETGFHNTVFQHMPIPLLKAVGFLLYRHIG